MLVECWKCRYTGYKICHYFSIHDPVERVTDMLQPGLYEKVINTALNSELSEIPDARKSVAPIDRAEASKVLAQYLADVVQKGLENVLDNGGDISAQIGLANQIVDLIQNTTQEADFAALSVDQRAEQLLALLREQDPRLAVGKTAADLSRPETSIAQSSLFTGAIHEPQMYTELKKEIVSADHIDMLVSFIKWSGLRLLMDELKEFTQNGGELRIITTSYMGATDVKAIEELRALPNTQIKVSYDTKRTRLHAKTYGKTQAVRRRHGPKAGGRPLGGPHRGGPQTKRRAHLPVCPGQNPEGTAGQAPPGPGGLSGCGAHRGQPHDSGRVAGPVDGGLRRGHPAPQHPTQLRAIHPVLHQALSGG